MPGLHDHLLQRYFQRTEQKIAYPQKKYPSLLRNIFPAVPPVTLYAAHNKTSWQFPCPCCPLLSPTAGIASSRMAWLHMYSLAFSRRTHPCTTPCCTCSVRREATCSLSYEQTQVHPLPSLVLAREATGCVTDFASHANAYLQCRRKILHCATWHFVPHAFQIAPACGTRSESPHCISSIRFRASGFPLTARRCSQGRLAHGRRRFYSYAQQSKFNSITNTWLLLQFTIAKYGRAVFSEKQPFGFPSLDTGRYGFGNRAMGRSRSNQILRRP